MPKIKLNESTRWMGVDYEPGDDVEVPLELAQALGHYLEEKATATSATATVATVNLKEPTTWMGVEYSAGEGVTVPLELAYALGEVVPSIPAQVALISACVTFLGNTYVLTQAINLNPEQVAELTTTITSNEPSNGDETGEGGTGEGETTDNQQSPPETGSKRKK